MKIEIEIGADDLSLDQIARGLFSDEEGDYEKVFEFMRSKTMTAFLASRMIGTLERAVYSEAFRIFDAGDVTTNAAADEAFKNVIGWYRWRIREDRFRRKEPPIMPRVSGAINEGMALVGGMLGHRDYEERLFRGMARKFAAYFREYRHEWIERLEEDAWEREQEAARADPTP